ncbi:hypothetical protein ACQEU6_08525 [Spirillospora sp. CA-108201]
MELITIGLTPPPFSHPRLQALFFRNGPRFDIKNGPAMEEGEMLAVGAAPLKVISTLFDRGFEPEASCAVMKFAVRNGPITLATDV